MNVSLVSGTQRVFVVVLKRNDIGKKSTEKKSSALHYEIFKTNFTYTKQLNCI